MEVVVPHEKRMIALVAVRPGLLLVCLLCLCGCAAMVQDVHLYYQQMAINYKEAEEKAKLDAVTLERESATLLQAGETHKYNRAQRELSRIKNWEEYCARQQERFQKAANQTTKAGAAGKEAIPATGANPENPSAFSMMQAQAIGNLACWLAGCLV